MINKPDFSKIARQIFKRNGGMQNPKLIHPSREWFIGLFVCVLIVILVAAWSAFTYTSYRNISVSQNSNGAGENIVYRESMVESALEQFAERAVEHESLINGSAGVLVEEPMVEVGEDIVVPVEEGSAETSTSTSVNEAESSASSSEPSAPAGDESNAAPPALLE
tara:strand:- start:6935 stop:7429 length:495 start_codon:yes stop_codon:yes gene_type:complete